MAYQIKLPPKMLISCVEILIYVLAITLSFFKNLNLLILHVRYIGEGVADSYRCLGAMERDG